MPGGDLFLQRARGRSRGSWSQRGEGAQSCYMGGGGGHLLGNREGRGPLFQEAQSDLMGCDTGEHSGVHRYRALSSQALGGQGLSLTNDPLALCWPGPRYRVPGNTQDL